MGAPADLLWKRIERVVASSGAATQILSLSKGLKLFNGNVYWQRYRSAYADIDQGREKALEHGLTFELLDFSRVRRYCDVAAGNSRIQYALIAEWPQVEHWKQDMSYKTDLSYRIIGGPAERMKSVRSGFFDALTLHCSFEHFSGLADVKFITEVDRILSPCGACLILPLYVAATHRIFFDPTTVTVEQVSKYDSEAELRPVIGYRQQHGRFYSPDSLVTRLLKHVPITLRVSLIRFTEQDAVDPNIYLNFAMVLHRPDSIFRAKNVSEEIEDRT